MAGNGSSGKDGQDPWRRPSENGPPDLLQLIKKFLHKTSTKAKAANQPSNYEGKIGGLVGIVIGVIIVLWVLSGIYIVAPAEQAVVLRFGKYVRTVDPGPHWVARFIESEQKVNVQRIDSFPYESDMLSKDENIVTVKLQVQYRISNAKDYLFNVVDPVNTLQQAVSSALRQMVGQMDLDPLLTTGRAYLTEQVIEQLNKNLDLYKTGVTIVDVALQEVKPPGDVTAAFDDVVKAREDRQSYINKAEAYAKNRVLLAGGIAARLKQDAIAYRYTVIAEARGETSRYLALLHPYQQAPEVMRQRLYLDTMSYVLAKTNNIVVDSNQGNNMLYVPIEQMLARRAAEGKQVQQANPDDTLGLDASIGQASPSGASSLERPSYSSTHRGQK